MAGYTVQVKRPRNQDPLDALVFQGTKRKRDIDDGDGSLGGVNDADFIFRLAQTYDTQQKHVVLQKYGGGGTKEMFRVAGSRKSRKIEPADDEIPEQLQKMISEYIKHDSPKAELNIPDVEDVDKETEDYVYDVYYTERAGPLTGSKIGYIEADEDERKLILGNNGESDDDSDYILDGEDDSNAEDYYKNDYPEEEDEEEDDIYSPYDSDNDLLGEDIGVPINQDEWSEAENEDEYDRYGWIRH